jgi:hypothetical protein
VEGIWLLRAEVIISHSDKASELKILGVCSMIESVGLCVLNKLDLPMRWVSKNTPSSSVSASDKVRCGRKLHKSGSFQPVS